MRPVISKLLERNGKTCWLPIPARYMEMLECVKTLGIKTEADEEDMRIVKYRSLIGVAPDAGALWFDVEDTAKHLSTLTPGQLDALTKLCAEFSLNFDNIRQFFGFIETAKQMPWNEFVKKAIKKTNEGAE